MKISIDGNASIFYGVVGSGRLATHLAHYLSLLSIPYTTWSRKEANNQTLQAALKDCSHVLLAVSDRAIADVATLIPADKKLIHFSGATVIPDIASAHPLMTFPPEVGDLEWYKKIPFAISEGESLAEILPGLPNPWFTVSPKDRALYHALISMTGNFPFILWQNTFGELQNKFGLTQQQLAPYLQQVVKSFLTNPTKGLTGPIARQDFTTIERHLEALQPNPSLESIYQAFLKLSQVRPS